MELANVVCRYAEIRETLEFGAEAVKGEGPLRWPGDG
jgi:hypothetical protein